MVEQAALNIHASSAGTLVVTSDLDWPEFRDLVDRIRAEDGRTAQISVREQVWAGPYEIYLAVQPLLDSTTGIIGTGVGLSALIMELVRGRPEQPITVHIDNSRTIVVNRSKELTADEAAEIDRLAEKHDTNPNAYEWVPPGHNPDAS